MLGMLLVILPACSAVKQDGSTTNTGKDAPATISQEDKELLERIKAKEKAKADLQVHPSEFLIMGVWDKFDSGISAFSTRTTKATAVEFTNHSDFDVTEIEGHFTYQNGNGEELATVPFTAEGDLPAGETRKLRVSAKEVTGFVMKGRALVEKIRILGAS
jgi:hypothetical protein